MREQVARGRTQVIGFSISIAAERAGMHPQTLREYERKGLLTPQRTPGGARRYRDEEVARLRRIQQLTEQGLSLAGVAYVLRLEDEVHDLRHQVSSLEQELASVGRDPMRSGSRELVPTQRSLSVEIVHVPRQPRGPRWRNDLG